jgi:hypothetical protein
MIVSSEIASVAPNPSPMDPSKAVSLAANADVLAQPAAGLTYTYTAPFDPLLSCEDPTNTVSPEIATACPNPSFGTPPDAVSFASKVDVSAQPEAGLTKTYAAARWANGAPTTIVSPENATELPKAALSWPMLRLLVGRIDEVGLDRPRNHGPGRRRELGRSAGRNDRRSRRGDEENEYGKEEPATVAPRTFSDGRMIFQISRGGGPWARLKPEGGSPGAATEIPRLRSE